MLLTDSRGTRYQLSRIIGKGGQATVYRVAGNSTHLAKVYQHPNPDDEKKLTWMVMNPPDDPSAHLHHASIAWPTQLLYNPDKSFAGYLMPFVKNAVAMLYVFNPRLRAKKMPEFDIRYLHRTARNLAAALGALHARDYVVGDLNESNVMVTPTTLVTMIDTDSFQVRASPRGKPPVIYPCPVGKFEYLPPELQSRSLKNVYRLPEHDQFALAVLIFQLLMDGNHPFRARWNRSGEVPPLEERIRAGWYPYRDGSVSNSGRLPVSPPDNAPDPVFLHPAIVDLFQQCFILGHDSPSVRPTAEEWENVIAQAEKAIRPCGRGHYFSTHLRYCPYCGVEYPDMPVEVVSAPEPPKLSPAELLAELVANHLASERAAANAGVGSSPGNPMSRGSAPTMPRGGSVPFSGAGSGLGSSNIAQLFIQLMNGLPGKLVIFSLLGAGVGGFLGSGWTGLAAGRAIGIAGGLVSGAMFSETIEKRFSWAVTLGLTGAGAGAFFMWQAGFDTILWMAAGLMGGVVGFLAGVVGRPTFWAIVWAFIGAYGGYYFGGSFGGALAEAWAGGALSGGIFGALTGGIYWAWRKFG